MDKKERIAIIRETLTEIGDAIEEYLDVTETECSNFQLIQSAMNQMLLSVKPVLRYIEFYQGDIYGATRAFDHKLQKYVDRGVQVGFHTVQDVREQGIAFKMLYELRNPLKGHIICRVSENEIIDKIVAHHVDSSD